MAKHLSLILVPHDNSRMRNYRLSYPLVVTFLALIIIAVLTLVGFVMTYTGLLVKAAQSDLLARENTLLKERNAEIDSLRTELVRLQTMGIQIKDMLGVTLSTDDSTLVANLLPIVNSPAISTESEADVAIIAEQRQMLQAIPSLWPVRGWVTKEFFITGGDASSQYHPGMDIAAVRNTAIQASADGVVVTSGWDGTYGHQVVVDHGFGIQTLYGHNARNLVQEGDRITRGQTLGFLGSTGKSTAPHVHFEVRKNGVAVDPRNYLLN